MLSKTVEHIPEEAHYGAAREGAEVMMIEVEVDVDDMFDVRLVEILKEVGEDDCTVVLPGVPCLISCETGEDKFWVEV